jgi:hypothetical protein
MNQALRTLEAKTLLVRAMSTFPTSSVDATGSTSAPQVRSGSFRAGHAPLFL